MTREQKLAIVKQVLLDHFPVDALCTVCECDVQLEDYWDEEVLANAILDALEEIGDE